ncbi:MAG: glucan biosynthesis protein [Hyphomicrobiales bacterium]|nr:glucan biosynthesis protein [Hyphomicrobiales bacterium]
MAAPLASMGRAAALLPLAASAAGAAAAQEKPASGAAGKARFGFSSVLNAARDLAKRNYKSFTTELPAPVASMAPAEQARIKIRPQFLTWADSPAGFIIEPVHRTRLTPGKIAVSLVEDGVAHALPFDPAQFDYPNEKPALSAADGLAGFKVYLRNDKGKHVPVCQFLAPDIYQAVGQRQTYGAVARPVSVRTIDGKAEEPVEIIAVWIEKPTLAQKALVVHALLNSRAMTGALRFTIHPGIAAIIDTECTLIARRDIKEFGLGAMSATHLSGSLDTKFNDDIRPEVHDVDGLQIRTGSDEWIWRPVANGQRLQVSGFVDKNPRGFGLLQRDRRFESYFDPENPWQSRPSIWIEPIGNWGAGQVNLLEIPSNSPINKNIGCYWRPAASLKAQSETRFAFRQFWCWTPPDRPPLAIVTRTRQGKAGNGDATSRRRFLVQYSGDTLFPGGHDRAIEGRASAANGKIASVKVYRSPQNKAVRVLFDVSAARGSVVELRLQLESAGRKVSETWLYRWTA